MREHPLPDLDDPPAVEEWLRAFKLATTDLWLNVYRVTDLHDPFTYEGEYEDVCSCQQEHKDRQRREQAEEIAWALGLPVEHRQDRSCIRLPFTDTVRGHVEVTSGDSGKFEIHISHNAEAMHDLAFHIGRSGLLRPTGTAPAQPRTTANQYYLYCLPPGLQLPFGYTGVRNLSDARDQVGTGAVQGPLPADWASTSTDPPTFD